MKNWGSRKPRPLKQRFWEKVDVRGPDECWPWMAAKDGHGYGSIGIGNRKVRNATHVLFYLRHDHWPPKGKQVNHHCDNRSCLNPRHLYLGTHKSNMCDMVKRGRGRSGQKKGEYNSNARFTNKKVRTIRKLYAVGSITYQEIGDRYGVDSGHISLIVNNKIWVGA